MKPVTATVTVPESREEVFDFLDVLGNHERFTDHFLVDWELSGPAAGVGARARMRLKKPGPADWLDMTVVAGERPTTTVEESLSAKGRRRTRGTYLLAAAPGGGTRITFRLEWLAAPFGDRLAAPLTRAIAGRSNERSLRRLADTLKDRSKEEAR
jgi:Polyketide cyclase / dehydrase and lipid transport